ncbi:MAG: ATP-dependent helicase [Thermoplasmata archaeon]
MIRTVSEKKSKKEILSMMEPIVEEWFTSKFSDLTEPQAYAIPLIHERKNVLVSSPTGTGKTITAFLSIINELLRLHRLGRLEDKIYSVYISPLKALANDVNKNLTQPLEEICTLAAKKRMKIPEIRIAVRSGDTTATERQKMVRKPPHIIITTPESFSIMLSTPKFRTSFRSVQWVIVDEIHEVSSSKRGAFLSLSLERLQAGIKKEFCRVGLSATQAPIEEIAKFLVGYSNGKVRDVNIVEVSSQKELDLSVVCPVGDLNAVPYDVVNAKMYDTIKEYINAHKTTLVFTNTRSGTESVLYKLKERGLDRIAAHHGSLSKDTRLDVEDKLKKGELQATISSTSLELGIDIGYIDLVCQLGSPKSVAKCLQRIGRAGHAVHQVSKGRLIAIDNDELVECAVLVRDAYESKIDRVSIPMNCLDVLAQTLVGMSLERAWNVEEAYQTVKRAYCYHTLSRKDFEDVLRYLTGKNAPEGSPIYSKIWYNPENRTFGVKKGSRMIYYLNNGTIPEEADYKVFSEKGVPLGTLSEKFVERISKGDVFLLGGKTYEYVQCKGMKVFVRDAQGKKPTVPSWSGEMLPRSYDLSLEIGKFRDIVEKYLTTGDLTNREIIKYLSENYRLDEGSAKSIFNYFKEQHKIFGKLPTHESIVIEGYKDCSGNSNIIFHSIFGRRINDALARAFAYVLGNRFRMNVKISLTDDNFMLTCSQEIPLKGIEKVVSSKDFKNILRNAIKDTELFKQRFRHCAMRAFMVLRNYKGKEIPVWKQHQHASKILEYLQSQGLGDFPIIKETYNEIFNEALDYEGALRVLEGIEKSRIKVYVREYSDTPSPFAHNVVLIGSSDIILMEDRSALLRELHKKVLGRVLSDNSSKQRLDAKVVKEYYKGKRNLFQIRAKEDIIEFLKDAGAFELFNQVGDNIFDFLDIKNGSEIYRIRTWAKELLNEGKIVSIVRGNKDAYIIKDDFPIYATLYAKDVSFGKDVDNGMNVNTMNKEKLEEYIIELLNEKTANNDYERISKKNGERNADKKNANKNIKSETENTEDDEDEFECESEEEINGRCEEETECEPINETMGKDEIARGKSVNVLKREIELKKSIKLEEKGVAVVLRNLEKRFRVYKSGLVDVKDGEEFLYSVREVKKTDFDESIRKVLLRYLEYSEPSTKEEISFRLGLNEEIVSSVLKDLENERIVECGSFTESDVNQYILTKDRLSIESIGKGKRTFDYDVILRYLLKKHFDCVDGVAEYMDKFISASMSYDVYARSRNFDMLAWWQMRSEGKLLHGRFVRGKVCFIKSEDAPLFVQAYRTESLNDVDLKVIELLRASDEKGISFESIVERSGLRKSIVKESIDKLDRNVYILRKYLDQKDWSSRNKYVPFMIDYSPTVEETKKAREEIVKRTIRAFGPIPLVSIRGYTGFPYEEIEQILSKLISEDRPDGEKIERISVIGEGIQDMYVFSEEIQKIEENLGKSGLICDKMRILSLYDPYIQYLWAEIASRYGEGWIYPVIKNGKLCGMVEKWQMSGCIDIREIKLDGDSKELLLELLKELDNMMKYYLEMGIEVIRVRKVFGKDVVDLGSEIIEVFNTHGYHTVQGTLVKGNIVPKVFNKDDVMDYILMKQHIIPEFRYDSVISAIEDRGYAFSDFEMGLRAKSFTSLRRYQRSGLLYTGLGIPEHFMYFTNKMCLIFKSAKKRPLDEEMIEIMNVMPESGSISRKNLFESVDMGEEEFADAVRRLYAGMYLIRDSRNLYMKVKGPEVDQQKARRYILKKIISSFGIISAEKLATITKHEYKMTEIRKLLRELEDAGLLVKGYFIEGDDALYWMIKSDFEANMIGKYHFRGEFVLSPLDPLSHYLHEEIRKQFGLGSCFVIFRGSKMTGAFKANKKGNVLTLYKFVGGEEEKRTMRQFESSWGLRISDGKDEKTNERQEEDDWELMLWWEKMHGGHGEK